MPLHCRHLQLVCHLDLDLPADGMSMPQVFSIGIGVVLRGIINSVGARNDKLAGALSGIWDGIVAYAAWRTDRLLEPTVLIEIIVGVCFDALYHGTPARLISLALGTVLGVLVSDTAGLHTLWDDLGENVQEKLKDLDFRDDLDSPDVLSEFSEDVTVVYEERATALSPRTRKMTTTEWIAAQRKAREHRSSKSATTSRRASASMNISTDLDRSILLSGFDTQTQVTTRTTQTQSSRARRDRELLESMTPLPPPSAPSVARNTDFDINIDVFSPSIATRISSPTIKTEIIEESSVHGTHEGAAINITKDASKIFSPPKSRTSRSHRSSRRESLPASVKPESTHPAVVQSLSSSSSETKRAGPTGLNPHNAFSEQSGHSTNQHLRSQTPRSRHTHTGTERTSFSPFIPPRPADSTREPTIISAHESHSAHVLPEDPDLDHVAAEVLSSWDDGLYARSVRSKSRASTRHSERFVEEPSVQGTQSRHTTIRSEGSVRPESRVGEGTQGYVESEASQRYSERPASRSPGPEVIIDYSGETTRIYIPPPAETGINVRIVPRAEDTQADQGLSEVDNSRSSIGHDHNHLDANYHYSGQPESLVESALRSQDDIVFIPQSIGSFPELETVPPFEEHNILATVDEDDTHHSHHSHASRAPSHASRAELSSDPQPPSIFKLKRAWRSSGSAPPASSPTTDFGGGGRVLEPDDPLPVYVTENVDDAFLDPAHVYIARSRSPSRSPSSVGNRQPEHSRSHSQSAASRHAHSRSHSHSRSHNHNNTLELDMQGEASSHLRPETKTPSVERFGPARSQTQSRDRNYSRSRRQSDASHDRRHSGSVVPIARSQDPRQSATFIDSPTVDGSIHRPSPNRSPNANSNAIVNNTDLATRAVQWEQQAIEMDTRCEALRVQMRDAERHGQNSLVFTLSCELENAEQRAKRLRRRAERAQLAAREAEHDDRIDVHRLSPLDAFQAVKNALYAIQQEGRSKLTVVVDHGRRAAEGSSVKRHYIIDKITKKYHFDVRSDEMNPNILYIFFPPNP
ncbi:hypothetical protein ACEPAI_7580 [Sanghuangporus weigelae]